MEPLENVLATITPAHDLSHLRALRTMYSKRFDPRIARYGYTRRAMRSWTESRETAHRPGNFGDQLDSCAFLSGFVQNAGGMLSDCQACSPRCSEKIRFAAALCLDCACGYYMCALAARNFTLTLQPTMMLVDTWLTNATNIYHQANLMNTSGSDTTNTATAAGKSMGWKDPYLSLKIGARRTQLAKMLYSTKHCPLPQYLANQRWDSLMNVDRTSSHFQMNLELTPNQS